MSNRFGQEHGVAPQGTNSYARYPPDPSVMMSGAKSGYWAERYTPQHMSFENQVIGFRHNLIAGYRKRAHLKKTSLRMRREIVHGANSGQMAIYVGRTRVWTQAARAVLYIFSARFREFTKPLATGEEAICLPHGLTNTLTVKLAVEYMEQYILRDDYEDDRLGWHVHGEVMDYLHLVNFFGFFNMKTAELGLHCAIAKRVKTTAPVVDKMRAMVQRGEGQRVLDAMASLGLTGEYTAVCCSCKV